MTTVIPRASDQRQAFSWHASEEQAPLKRLIEPAAQEAPRPRVDVRVSDAHTRLGHV